MGGFTFCCGDMGASMEAKGTVTNEILEMIEDDKRVCYINADGTGAGGKVHAAIKKYPDRVLDVGIQEMNMVTIAAGLAKKGYMPYVQTFGPFLCVRALDQIHNDIAYNDFPVRLIGTHAGISSGYGPTHNTIIEFGVMNSIPNMTMVAPCDAIQCRKLLRKSLDYPQPIYIRIPRGEEPLVYEEGYDYDYEIGKAIEIEEGKDLTIIATGMGVFQSVQAARKLEDKGLNIGVIDMHTIKPIDKEAIIKAAQKTKNIITVEDHNILGGLGSIVADVLMEAGVPARLKKIGIPDTFVEYGYPEELYPYYGMDADGIAKTVLEFLNQ
ncbi:MAG: transketolase C-terminal domain-containing protein [Lachnospiraceae bacterium]|nr:transketolase C-terminal domain-containing protein [Lachnospiraceae bacterium]